MYYGIRIDRSADSYAIDRSARAIAMRSRRSARADEGRYDAARAKIDGRAEQRRSARPAQAPGLIAFLRRS